MTPASSSSKHKTTENDEDVDEYVLGITHHHL